MPVAARRAQLGRLSAARSAQLQAPSTAFWASIPRPRFREYVVRERVPSYHYDSDACVGVVLPEEGVTYREVPAEFRRLWLSLHLCATIDPLSSEPRTRRIVEVVE